MMSSILVTTNDRIRSIVLNRPERRNAIDGAMLEILVDALKRKTVGGERAIVISANGPVFCAGLDLTIRRREGAPLGNSPIEAVLDALDSSELPTVAAVSGPAIGGGCELALNCDVTVADEHSSFSMPLARLGTAPTWVLVARLIERLGSPLSRDLLLTGKSISAERIARTGAIRLVNELVTVEAANEIALDIAKGAPLAIRAMRAMFALHSKREMECENGSVDAFVEYVRQSADAREGIAAQRDHRPPQFEGK